MPYSKTEKQAHFKRLRAEWEQAKQLAETEAVVAISAELRRMGLTDVSLPNVALVMQQAEALGLDGLPFIDFKTYHGWRAAGFQVRRGEKARVHTITWVAAKKKKQAEADDDSGSRRRWPKLTHLFHRSQVDSREVA